MNDNRARSKAERILEAALNLPSAERTAFLSAVCAEDQSLRNDLQLLLARDERAKDVIGEFVAAGVTARRGPAGRLSSPVSERVGRYEVIRKIGEGGMGVVHLAYDPLLNRQVALKLLPEKYTADKDRVRRFQQEALAASALNHPNILTIHDTGQTDRVHYIVTEFVDGRNLREQMNGDGLSLAKTLDVVMQVASALKAAHAAGIVHRDIKPENIMIRSGDGVVKVLDFGLAKLIEPSTTDSKAPTALHTQTGMLVGTPGYMSPEQLAGEAIDARSDLFSLGAVLYECLTSRPAFSGDTPARIWGQIQHVDPPPPSLFNQHVLPELDRITLKLLAKEKTARYHTANEMLVDLQNAASSCAAPGREESTRISPAGVATHHTSILKTISDVMRRPRFLILALVAALIVLTVSPAVYRKLTTHQPVLGLWYRSGVEALREGTYYKASKMLKKAIEVDGKHPLAHARYAQALVELDHMEEAMREVLNAENLGREQPMQPNDRLHLAAVNAVVRRDFDNAINTYKKLLEQSSSEEEKAYAYSDLGYAYAKGDYLEKAIESYREAARLNPQGAAAFLRLGTLLGRAQEWDDATAALDAAERLYRDMSTTEGLVETYYQKGIILTDLGRLDEAREHFQKALAYTQSIDNVYQRIRALLQMSRVSCLANNLVQAQQLAEQAIELASAENLVDLTAQGLTDVGNAFYFSRKNPVVAEDYYLRAIRYAQKNRGRNEARARLQLGILQIERNEVDAGRRSVEQALEFYQERNYPDESFDGYLQLGMAERQKGNFSTALQNFQKLLKLAERKNHPMKVAVSHEKIGSVLLLQGRYPEALAHFEESLTIGRSLGDTIGVGYGLVNSGNVLWRLGRYDAARSRFEEAIELANRPNGYKAILPEAYLYEAEMALSERRFRVAAEKSRRVLRMFEQEESAELSLEVKRVLGLAQVYIGAKSDGKQLCEEVVRLAETFGTPAMIARAKLTFAEVLIETGNAAGALEAASQIAEKLIQDEQHELAWRALLIVARAMMRIGHKDEVHNHVTRSGAELAKLQQQWGEEAYKMYFTRRDIQYYQSLLEQLSA